MITPSTVAWTTDIHLDAAKDDHRLGFSQKLTELSEGVDGLLIGGDISNGSSLGEDLRFLALAFPKPIYYVLGNHDFYGKPFSAAADVVRQLGKNHPNLQHLNGQQVVPLGPGTALIGHDGWYCGTAGEGIGSSRGIADLCDIPDLKYVPKSLRFDILRDRARESGREITRGLEAAASQGYRKIIVLTHVPPFPEATWHRGGQSEPDMLPFFCNQFMGQALIAFAREHREVEVLVLCGHTHGEGVYRAAANLTVVTNGAVTGEPALNVPFTVDGQLHAAQVLMMKVEAVPLAISWA